MENTTTLPVFDTTAPYHIKREYYRDGFAAFQKKFVMKRNYVMMALFFILSGIALGVLGLVNVPVWTILFMLILPLFLDIPSYLLGEVQNSIVDAAGREDNRAELLSVFNMGVNVTEIFYLFGSSLLVSAGSTACFVILGAFMTVVGIGICLSVKSAWLLSLQEKKNGN